MITTLTMTNGRGRQAAACSAVALASFGAICASSTGPVRQTAGLGLIGAFACALWLMRRKQSDAVVPAVGLTLVFLILVSLTLAALHALSTVPVALVLEIATLAVTWAGAFYPSLELTDRKAQFKAPHLLAVTGVLIFAAAVVLAVHTSSVSATADADGASSVALWAYPSGGQLHIGVQEPSGKGVASLRIVVTQAGVTVATWNDIHVAPGQTWEAPALSVTGTSPAQVVALNGATSVASLSSR